MKHLKIKDVMTQEPAMIGPKHTVLEAAQMMKEIDCGVLPVGNPEHVAGILTDRDIVLRTTAVNANPASTLVEDAMTKKHYACREEDDLEKAARMMREHNVSRLLVMKGDRVSGIVTLADLLRWPESLRESDRILHTLQGRTRETHDKAA